MQACKQNISLVVVTKIECSRKEKMKLLIKCSYAFCKGNICIDRIFV